MCTKGRTTPRKSLTLIQLLSTDLQKVWFLIVFPLYTDITITEIGTSMLIMVIIMVMMSIKMMVMMVMRLVIMIVIMMVIVMMVMGMVRKIVI